MRAHGCMGYDKDASLVIFTKSTTKRDVQKAREQNQHCTHKALHKIHSHQYTSFLVRVDNYSSNAKPSDNINNKEEDVNSNNNNEEDNKDNNVAISVNEDKLMNVDNNTPPEPQVKSKSTKVKIKIGQVILTYKKCFTTLGSLVTTSPSPDIENLNLDLDAIGDINLDDSIS
ncbi:hypothetical protein BV22DRAFT_1051526 [Leucogyrophana mollusca]|uniref:Uncharacterized protein n=1 Tax=Leucogyrophana mollusca TaxID=85980 RepID=A0ACB8AZC1_9AGAM|nr:hypothetical protein BV22DRAFT_1051526 [Leucogyrophana mollusca]